MSVNYMDITAQPEYDIQFWDAAKRMKGNEDVLAKGRISATGSYELPAGASAKVAKAMERESVFRNIATGIKAYKSGYRIFSKDCKDLAQFIPENGEIPVYDGMKDFDVNAIGSHKLAVLVKMDEDFVRDVAFALEQHLIGRFAKNFGKAEDNAFINGTGENEPTGILHDSNGAETGKTTESLTYDDVIALYFSVEKDYRKNGVWMMNDSTALTLRTLKDADGNYLWNHADNTILGKRVVISEYMPDAAEGAKPIAFGDFAYYWIIDRRPVSVRTLVERFAMLGQVGYLAFKFLDSKLIRRDAVKVIQIKAPDQNM